MTERCKQLHATADEQIGELIALISGLDAAALCRPCPGREKLGDGTVGASARHTADNYQRIAGFVKTSDPMSGAHGPAQHGGHRIPRFLRAIGHGPSDHAEPDPRAGGHDGGYTADTIDVGAVLEQLSASRDALGRIAELTDSQLNAIPPDGSFRFCDGQCTSNRSSAASSSINATRSTPSGPPSPEHGARARVGGCPHPPTGQTGRRAARRDRPSEACASGSRSSHSLWSS